MKEMEEKHDAFRKPKEMKVFYTLREISRSPPNSH
jgi:hypothetical protein